MLITSAVLTLYTGLIDFLLIENAVCMAGVDFMMHNIISKVSHKFKSYTYISLYGCHSLISWENSMLSISIHVDRGILVQVVSSTKKRNSMPKNPTRLNFSTPTKTRPVIYSGSLVINGLLILLSIYLLLNIKKNIKGVCFLQGRIHKIFKFCNKRSLVFGKLNISDQNSFFLNINRF